MTASQRETGPAVIEVYVIPSARVMAGTAVVSKLSGMGILLSVTGKTIGGCVFIFAIDMTGGARCSFMAANQREAG